MRSPRLTCVSELKAPPALAHRLSRPAIPFACHDVLLLSLDRWSGCEDLNLGPPGSEPGTLNRTELHPVKIALAPAARKRKNPTERAATCGARWGPDGTYARRHAAGAPSELLAAGRPCRIAAGTNVPAALAAFAGAVPGIDVRNLVIPAILMCVRSRRARAGIYRKRQRSSSGDLHVPSACTARQAPMMAATERSASASPVAQEVTERRMIHSPFHCAPAAKHVPSA